MMGFTTANVSNIAILKSVVGAPCFLGPYIRRRRSESRIILLRQLRLALIVDFLLSMTYSG